MAEFSKFGITNDGINLELKAQTGKELKFSKFKLGDGYYTADIKDLTDLVHSIETVSIKRLEVSGTNTSRKCIIGFNLDTKSITTGFYLREIGIYAIDPDTSEELLVFYGNSGDTADYISNESSSTISQKIIDIEVYLDDVANITAVIDTSVIYATKDDVDDSKTELISFVNNKFNEYDTEIQQQLDVLEKSLKYNGVAPNDLNDARDFGIYRLFTTYTNAPTANNIYGILIVYTSTGETWNPVALGGSWIWQEIITTTGKKYYRNASNSADGWSEWLNVDVLQTIAKDNNLLMFRGSISNNSDANNIKQTGIYYTATSTISNMPTDVNYAYTFLIVIGISGYVQQYLIEPVGNILKYRAFRGNPAAWNPWKTIGEDKYIQKSNIAILTGTSTFPNKIFPERWITSGVHIDYPNGFTKNNCVCIALGIGFKNGDGFEYGDIILSTPISDEYRATVSLESSTILLMLSSYSETSVDVNYKIVLMKIS